MLKSILTFSAGWRGKCQLSKLINNGLKHSVNRNTADHLLALAGELNNALQ
jgi:hypothetical protein